MAHGSAGCTGSIIPSASGDTSGSFQSYWKAKGDRDMSDEGNRSKTEEEGEMLYTFKQPDLMRTHSLS